MFNPFNVSSVSLFCLFLSSFLFFGDLKPTSVPLSLSEESSYQIKLSLAPLGKKDCLCLTVRDTGILRCAGLVLQYLRLWP